MTRSRRRRCAAIAGVLAASALVALAPAGCRREPARTGGPRYPVKGKAVAVDAAKRSLTIAHEDIPNFMPAMTMEFVVLERDAPLLERVSPGDDVAATLVTSDSRYWLEDVVVVKKGTPPPGAPASQLREAQPGDPVPDVALVDQDGRAFRLSGLAGRAYALTFVFTRCPLPDFCPLMMKDFAAAEVELLADPALREATRLVTVSFDPKHDTPEVLRRFGLPFQKSTPPFTHWKLATGTDEAIRRLGGVLELDYVEETASFTHNLRTAVVSPDGRLARLFRGNEWQPAELVEALRAVAVARPATTATPAQGRPRRSARAGRPARGPCRLSSAGARA